MTTQQKIRVSILGGGPAGLAAAFGLTATPELRARYDVTVWQVGWRVGGKCSSGRQAPTQRILQNGTHYMFGAYNNCFGVARKAFDELLAAGDQGFGTFEQAFIPQNFLAMKQFFQGNWHTWPVEFPVNSIPLGEGPTFPTLPEVLSMLLQGMIEGALGWGALYDLQEVSMFRGVSSKPGWWDRLVGSVDRDAARAFRYVGVKSLQLALSLARTLHPGERWERDVSDAIIWLVEEFRRWLWSLVGGWVEKDLDANRRWILFDLAATHLIGFLRDRVLEKGGLASLDRHEYREWLALHGARELTIWSPPVTTWYNAVAAYEDGEISRPNLSAAVTLNCLLRLIFAYKGSFAYMMSREVGESFIAPLFQALRQRGVHFMFFHRVWDVLPSEDDGRIERVVLEQQAHLLSGDPASYEPFIRVKDYQCWPNEPLWSQLSDPDRSEPDYESFFRPRKGPSRELVHGRDFDQLIFALPVGTLPFYCGKVLERRKRWREMHHHVRTVETQSLRTWWLPDLHGMGWHYPPPVLSGYLQPLSTWENASYLLNTESWPFGQRPQALSTVYGTLPSPRFSPGPEHSEYPKRQQEVARRTALQFLQYNVGSLWPGVSRVSNPVGVAWEQLADPEDRQGEARFDAQVPLANCGPLQRYTMATAGALKYRLRANETGYVNLMIAGDWVRTGFEIGSTEGSVMSGLQAARAICGEPLRVPGEEHL